MGQVLEFPRERRAFIANGEPRSLGPPQDDWRDPALDSAWDAVKFLRQKMEAQERELVSLRHAIHLQRQLIDVLKFKTGEA